MLCTLIFIMGFALVHKRQFEDAIREFKLATRLGDAGSLSALGYGYAMAGNTECLTYGK